MNARPILFTGPMVRAILAGKKTQTRRVVKPQPPSPAAVLAKYPETLEPVVPAWCFWPSDESDSEGRHADHGSRCPCGGISSQLWVRETWAPAVKAENRQIAYAADGRWCSTSADWALSWQGWVAGVTDKTCPDWQELRGHWVGRSYFQKWRPSIHMPRWASRITLEVTGVRIGLLQSITEKDAIAEGVGPGYVPCPHHEYPDLQTTRCVGYRPMFANLWDKLNGKSSYSWNANPWVWVVEFQRVQR